MPFWPENIYRGNLKHAGLFALGYLKGLRHPPLPESWWGSVCQDTSTHIRMDRPEQFCPCSKLQASWSEGRMVTKEKHSDQANVHREIKEQHTHHISDTCLVTKGWEHGDEQVHLCCFRTRAGLLLTSSGCEQRLGQSVCLSPSL